jgi:hypothetical protein
MSLLVLSTYCFPYISREFKTNFMCLGRDHFVFPVKLPKQREKKLTVFRNNFPAHLYPIVMYSLNVDFVFTDGIKMKY